MIPDALTYSLLLAFLVPAVLIDHQQHRIPNFLSGGLLLIGLLAHVVFSGLEGFTVALFGAAVGFGIFLIPYIRRGMAAGDVKLMAAVGAVLGPEATVVAACVAMISGAGVGILLLSYRSWRDDPRAEALLLMRFPYASAIAMGAAAAVLIKEFRWTL
jgi:prepilin peptidase CpaA